MSRNSFFHSCLINTPICNLILILAIFWSFLNWMQFNFCISWLHLDSSLIFPLKCKTLCLLLHINGFYDAKLQISSRCIFSNSNKFTIFQVFVCQNVVQKVQSQQKQFDHIHKISSKQVNYSATIIFNDRCLLI